MEHEGGDEKRLEPRGGKAERLMCQTNVKDGMRNKWKAAKEAIQRIGGGSERHAGGLTFVSKCLVIFGFSISI